MATKLKTPMKPFSFMILIFLACGQIFSQNSETSFAEEYLPIWESARRITLELAEAMPEDKYSFMPTDEIKSFGEQMVHIGHSTVWSYQFIVEGKKEGRVKSPKASEMNKQEIIAYLDSMLSMQTENIRNHPPDDLGRLVNYFGEGKISVKWALIFIQDHLVNHRSKANLYFRLLGLEPPEYQNLKTED